MDTEFGARAGKGGGKDVPVLLVNERVHIIRSWGLYRFKAKGISFNFIKS